MKKLHCSKKLLSALLCLCMLAGLMPSAFAELCPHHTSHIDCGYAEATSLSPCTHTCDETCAEDCAHSHDESCGYAEGSEGAPCGYVCQECANSVEDDPSGTDDSLTQQSDDTLPPEDTTVPPEDTTVPPEDTTVPPDDSLIDPDDTPDVPDDTQNSPDSGAQPPEPAQPRQPQVEGVLITREQYDISRLSIDESGNLIFGVTAIAPQAIDPESGEGVSGRFSWGGAAAPLVILNEVGSASYPLYFIPDDSASYSNVSLSLVVVTEEYVSKASGLVSRLPMGALASLRASSPTSCTVAVISDSDTLYMEAALNKFKTSLKPLNGQELERILSDNSVTGKIIIDATYSGLRVDRIQLYSFTLRSFMDAIRNGESGLESILIKLSGGEMELDLKALESLCINDDCSSVELVINRDSGQVSFNDSQKEALRQHNVRLISRIYFDCSRRETPQSDYGEGSVRIGIPFYYGDIKLCAIAEDGTLTELEKSFENGLLSWTVSEGCDFVLIK